MAEQSPNRGQGVSGQGKKMGPSPVQSLVYAVNESGRPWWFEAFGVAKVCVVSMYAPIKIISEVAGAIVSLAFVAIIALIALWYVGYIPDSVVVKYMTVVGDRLFSIVKSSGVL